MAETTTTDEIEFDLSQLDDTLISDQQKQALSDYINQIKSEKRSINEDFNQLKLSTGISDFDHQFIFANLIISFNANERIFFFLLCFSIFSSNFFQSTFRL